MNTGAQGSRKELDLTFARFCMKNGAGTVQFRRQPMTGGARSKSDKQRKSVFYTA